MSASAARRSDGIELRLHPRQGEMFQSPARELLFGGAAGGGKSHALRVALISWAHAIPGLQCYLFRRTYPELISNHIDGPAGMPTLLGPWIEMGYVKWRESKSRADFANGSSIILCHCQRESDRFKYQGAEIHVLAFDELTLFSETIYRFLRSRVRMSGVALPTGWGSFPRVVATSNPGGVGHNWVKKTWRIGELPAGRVWTAPEKEGGLSRQFIASLLSDNPSLDEADYGQRLQGLKDPRLVRAMLEGDWDIEAGGMFDDLFDANVHTLPMVRSIPPSWRVTRSYDWGSSKPWVVLWHARADGETPIEFEGDREPFCPSRGSVVTFFERYGWNGEPNVGDKSTSVCHAEEVRRIESRWQWRVVPGCADSSIYNVTDGRCIADEHRRAGVTWKPSAKGPGSRANGWEVMRTMLHNAKQREGAGWYVSEACANLLRTMVAAARDEKKPDDIDTDYEDHALDAARYELASMPPAVTERLPAAPWLG